MIKQLAILALVACGVVAAQAQTVYYENREVRYSGNDRPYSSRGTLMVPARRTAELIGASFDRDSSGRRISMRWRNNRVEFYQGERQFTFNGRRTSMANTSEVRYDTLFVPYEMFRELTDRRFGTNRNSAWGDDDFGRRRPGDPDDPWNRGNRYDPRNGRYDNRNNYGRGQITWDNRPLTFDYREQPYEKGGVLMVPFREMGERIGARTDRTSDGLRVWIYFGGDRVEYNKGHTWFRLNSDRRELRTVSEDRNDILFVPITLFESITRGRLRSGYGTGFGY